MTPQVFASFFIAFAALAAFVGGLFGGKVFLRGPGFVFEFERDENPQGFWLCQISIALVGIGAATLGVLILAGMVPVDSR